MEATFNKEATELQDILNVMDDIDQLATRKVGRATHPAASFSLPILLDKLPHNLPRFRSINPPILIRSHHLPNQEVDFTFLSSKDLFYHLRITIQYLPG